MASNNSGTIKPPLSRLAYRNGPDSPLAIKRSKAPYDSDGLGSDDDTLLALSSLAKMETNCQNENGLAQREKSIAISTVIFDSSADYIDIVQQAIDAVEDALVRCPKYARREALTELLMHAKLEQAKKATAYSSSFTQNANVWAEMLMQVQELGRNYPKDPQVHELVYLVQQCLTRNENYESLEGMKHSYDYRNDVRQEQGEPACEKDILQPETDDETELCGRLEEVGVDVDIEDNDRDSIGYRITEEYLQAMSNQIEDESSEANYLKNLESKVVKVGPAVEEENKSTRFETATKLRELVPILTGNVVLKGVQVPQLPRGSDGWSSSDSDDKNLIPNSALPSKIIGRSSRQKFQFPEKELLKFLENEDGNSSLSTPEPIRRYSHNSKITRTVPLRRKSFIMKRTSLKSSNIAETIASVTNASTAASGAVKTLSTSPDATKSTKQRMAPRRKSTSACKATIPSSISNRRNCRSFSVTKQQVLASNNKQKSATLTSKLSTNSFKATASPPSPVPSSQTQMVLRVRARDGVPELLIAKKPVRCVVWHWNDRCIRVPFMSTANMMELGPAQHGIMLRQLRYVKSMMHDFPWAKVHLRSLLSRYTAKEVTKEELYPQLNALGQQVQREISARAKQHRTLTAQKQRLTITLTLATNLVNDTVVTKFGRRGRPHASRLLYDPATPLQLRWRRKHGERSSEFLLVDKIQVIEGPDNSMLSGGLASFGRGNKKAAAAVAVDPESCLSLVTPTRALDLQVASALHREWLANAVRDIVSFAQQYKVAKGNSSENSNSSDFVSDSNGLARRSRPASSSQDVLLY